MAKFLTTVGNSYYIEQILLGSKDNFTIVTPFLKLSETFIDRIKDAEKRGVRITFIYGKSELIPSQREFLFSLKNLKVFFYKNLHAKCYHNETQMVITSMNLYEFSERNNREMGILIEKDNDTKMFEDALKEIDSIKNASLLEKDFESVDASNSDNEIALDETYNKNWNFHLPAIKAALENKFPSQNFTLDDSSVSVDNFPSKGIDLSVSGRVDFRFDNHPNFNRLKRMNEYQLSEGLPGVRFYWNNHQINIYPERNFTADMTEEGLIKKVNKQMQIIEHVVKNLKT